MYFCFQANKKFIWRVRNEMNESSIKIVHTDIMFPLFHWSKQVDIYNRYVPNLTVTVVTKQVIQLLHYFI